jgi:hypothetical protein
MRRNRRGNRAIYRAVAFVCESLESRTLLSGVTLHIVPHSQRPFTTFVIPAQGSTLEPPYTPSEVRTAYGLNNINFSGVIGNGAGQTIALIEAFNDPDLASDANKFSSMYGLPQFTIAGDGPTLTIENEYGSTSNLPPDSQPGVWDAEDSLDVEWAHAVAPEANILVVEGNAYTTNDNTQFIANETIALNTAKDTPGVSVVSMSFLVPLTSSEAATDPTFVSPSAQQGITFFAASGDSGTPEGYPADSPNVVGVGGASLTINGDGSIGGQGGWSGSGGGISPYEAQPVWQSADAMKFSKTQRTVPDVAWLADPDTGVVVLDSFYSPVPFNVGGTSLAAPMWAALTSIVDQGRNLAGLPTLDGASQTLPLLYNLPSSDFNDLTTGNNGFAAGPGYDLVTGLGSPNVAAIVNDMVAAKFVYVDASAGGPTHDGSSWADAYTSLQSVLMSPSPGKEYVLVGQGTYLPGNSSASTFQLQDNMTIIGGFAGYGTTDADSSGTAFPTILSGNLGGGQNSNHVVTGSGTNSTAVLIGFTISGGAGGAQGGGLYDSSGSPTLDDCDFTSDSATDGGGMYNLESSPTLTACTFSDDTATDGGAEYEDAGSAPNLSYCTFTDNMALAGGALYVGNASPTLTYCTFLTNSATGPGGGVEAAAGAAQGLINCIFNGNTADTEGGGVAEFSSAGLVFGCVFAGNAAPLGGGISVDSSSSPTITNCTFDANSAGEDGGGLYDGNSTSPVVTNCIFWLDSAPVGDEIFSSGGSVPVVTYSDVDGGYAGDTNLNVDPAFVRDADPQDGDYGDLELQQFSMCINVGNNAAVPPGIVTDAAGRARIVGEIVDLGAYESPSALLYVDASAPGPTHDGGSWATAFTNLQDALNTAGFGFTILVAQGDYSPGPDPTATFQLIDDVTIEGGYAGFGTPNPNAQDDSAYPTILDGHEMNYHVVTANGTDDTAVLEGVTITGGNADGYSYYSGFLSFGGYGDGGGVYSMDGSPTLINCDITGDSASEDGGGIYSGGEYTGSSPTLINCEISGDSAYSGAGMYNGGIYAGAPTLINCKFQNDHALYYGGAFTNGGLIYNAPATLINCTMEGDSAGLAGNAIQSGISYYGYGGNSVTLVNCIVYGDGPDEINGNATITYSDIQGGYSGKGNINVNPLFESSTNLQLEPTSPCINVGSNAALPSGDTTDLAGNPRVFDNIVDMGAYEAQAVDVSWTGDGDSKLWNNGGNWSDKQVPTADDTTTIGQGFGTIEVPSGTFAVNSLNASSSLQIDTGATLQFQNDSVLTGELTILGTGTIDITRASLTIDYAAAGEASPLTMIQQYLADGYSGGAWNGTGILSSTAAAHPGDSVGYADGSVDTGTPAMPGEMLIQYTRAGDALLNGTVNFNDLDVIGKHLNTSGNDWADGNFNYAPNGAVNFNDLDIVGQNLNTQVSPAAATAVSQGGSTVSLGESAAPATPQSPPPSVVRNLYDENGTTTTPAAQTDPIDGILLSDIDPDGLLIN